MSDVLKVVSPNRFQQMQDNMKATGLHCQCGNPLYKIETDQDLVWDLQYYGGLNCQLNEPFCVRCNTYKGPVR